MRQLVIILAASVLLTGTATAQTTDSPGRASETETPETTSSGDETFAVLDENRNSPRYVDFFERALLSAPTITTVDTLMEDYFSGVVNPIKRQRLLVTTADIYALAHRYDKAKRYYLQARQIDPKDVPASLGLATMLLEEGSVQEAIIILSNLVVVAETREIQRRSAILRARAYYLNGEVERAIAHGRSLAALDTPPTSEMVETVEVEALFLLADIAISEDNTDLLREVTGRMNMLFPDAPETVLAKNKSFDTEGGELVPSVVYYPSPSRLVVGSPWQSKPLVSSESRLPPVTPDDSSSASGNSERPIAADTVTTNPDGDVSTSADAISDRNDADERRGQEPQHVAAGVQTGSFRDRENAEYMAIDIEEYGFDVEIRSVQLGGDTFYRVIVPVPPEGDASEAQRLVIALKERGVEGFLVFE